ncbi:MAG: sugar transferase [Marinosulfonomonas sp.]
MSYTFVDDVTEQTRTQRGRMTLYKAFGKRFLDIVLVLLASPIAVPVVLFATIGMSFGGAKGIYGQPRIGRDGRVFRCWKIRTMVPNADEVLLRLVASDTEIAREWHLNQKLDHDPRITPLGYILRKLSIDELPQFWNVLTGEMSLIGPRPFTPEQKALYDENGPKRAYYRVRPGISGLWQVECRNQGGFCERVKYDEAYAENISLGTDLKIAIKTVAAIAGGTGQ